MSQLHITYFICGAVAAIYGGYKIDGFRGAYSCLLNFNQTMNMQTLGPACCEAATMFTSLHMILSNGFSAISKLSPITIRFQLYSTMGQSF